MPLQVRPGLCILLICVYILMADTCFYSCSLRTFKCTFIYFKTYRCTPLQVRPFGGPSLDVSSDIGGLPIKGLSNRIMTRGDRCVVLGGGG